MSRWYFALISVSGIFAVTFSVIFAYVADITEEHERSAAYGKVTTAPVGVTGHVTPRAERLREADSDRQRERNVLPVCVGRYPPPSPPAW